MFQSCQWIVLAGFERAHWMGISAQEIDAVCRLQNVPRAEWPDVLLGVRMMAGAAAAVLNEKKD